MVEKFLFNLKKQSTVKYFIDTDIYDLKKIPKAFFKNIEHYETHTKLGCPAMNSIKNTVFVIKSPISVDVEFYEDKENYRSEFTYDVGKDVHFTAFAKTLIEEMLTIQFNGTQGTTFQIILPYIFVTDDKDISVTVLPPNIPSENTTFTAGSFNIHSWLRPVNSGWFLTGDVGKISVKEGEPLLYVVFNKPVDLEYISSTNDMRMYSKEMSRITLYKKNINKVFKEITNRRPKKFL